MSKTLDEAWVVWNPLRGVPTKKHAQFYTAEEEATRLAREHPGETFLVCEVVASVRVPPDVEKAYTNRFDPPLPF